MRDAIEAAVDSAALDPAVRVLLFPALRRRR